MDAPVPPRGNPVTGIGLMLAGCLIFSLNDALGKWLVATYSVGQLLLIRSLAALIVLVPFLHRYSPKLFAGLPRPGVQVARIFFATIEVALFYWAVSYLPLADVVTFYLAGPIFVTALSGLLLGEVVGWRRWSAVLIGFVGVVVAMRPSSASLSWPALIALAGSFTFSLSMITTRLVRGTPDLVLITYQTAAALVFGLAIAPVGWVTPSPQDSLLLSLLGIVALIAHVCVNRSLKLADATVVVPYQYSLIVWAIALGFLVFGDVPDPALILGAGIIILAGLFIFLRERDLARQGEEAE